MKKRVFVIVLDSVGIGAMPDWKDYDEECGNTLGHIAEAVGGLNVPHLEKMGLGNIAALKGVAPAKNPMASWGKASLSTHGKDTTAGHWEMMGIYLDKPFPTFPKGFPAELVTALEGAFQKKILGKEPASGTAIIEELGEEHLKTGCPIVYTSGDSVVQIACHEDVYNTEALYELCEKARVVCRGKYGVGRVIARPFRGEKGHFERTQYRKDYSLVPPKPNTLSLLRENGIPVVGVGKISDIFSGQDIDISYGVKGNTLCMEKTLSLMEEDNHGFFFINLVDFDMLYGHRNDAHGYASAIEDFDVMLPLILQRLQKDDLLIITADHGNDPTTKSTDHNREYVPILSYASDTEGKDIGIRATMSDIGATVLTALCDKKQQRGESWLEEA